MRYILALALSLLCSAALAQSVQQSGTVTPGHVPMWTTNGVIQDAGTAVQGFLSGVGVTASGPGICQNSGSVTGPYNQLCISLTATGGAFTFNNFGGATGSPTMVINGTSYQFPFSAGAVSGPGSTTVGHVTTWNNTSGTLLADSGFAITAPGAANAIPYWSGTAALTSIAAVNNAVVVTSGAGVPSEATTLPSGLTVPSPTFSGTMTMPDASTWTSSALTIADPVTHNGTATFAKQIISTFGTPTIASGACGATTNGAIVAGSTNQSGNITIGSASTTTCTISFSVTLGTAPNACIIFPTNATAAATGTTVARVSSVTASQFVITGSVLASANYEYICL